MTYPESSLSRMDKEDEGKPLGECLADEEAGEKKIGHDRDKVFKRKKMTRSSIKKGGEGVEMYKKGNRNHCFLIFIF